MSYAGAGRQRSAPGPAPSFCPGSPLPPSHLPPLLGPGRRLGGSPAGPGRPPAPGALPPPAASPQGAAPSPSLPEPRGGGASRLPPCGPSQPASASDRLRPQGSSSGRPGRRGSAGLSGPRSRLRAEPAPATFRQRRFLPLLPRSALPFPPVPAPLRAVTRRYHRPLGASAARVPPGAARPSPQPAASSSGSGAARPWQRRRPPAPGKRRGSQGGC